MSTLAVRYKQGFTLPELFVAMLAFSILLLAGSLMLSFGWKHWYFKNEVVNLQRDAILAQAVIRREIRCSSKNDISISSNRIDFAAQGVRSSTGAESIYVSGPDLILSDSGGNFVLIRGMLTEFSPTMGTDYVNVSLTLSTPDGKIASSQALRVYPRN